jgi:hypothetical protein
MMILSEMDDRQLGQVFGIVVFVGAFLFYIVSRIVKGFKKSSGLK